MLKFWAIAYKYQEDIYADFRTKEDTDDLNESCFLPSKEMAEQIVEEQLGIQYVPVEIEVISYREGTLVTSRGPVEEWDEGNI